MTGIYKITNLINNKSYIGQSLDIELRFKQHKEAIQNSNISWYPVARSESNSINDFNFEILQTCSPTELDELEEYWIKKYNTYKNGYNKTVSGLLHKDGIKFIFIKKEKELSTYQIYQAMKKMKGNTFKLWMYFYYKFTPTEGIVFSPRIICEETGLSENAPLAALNDLVKINYCQKKENNYYITYN